jgi:hypothetical protein
LLIWTVEASTIKILLWQWRFVSNFESLVFDHFQESKIFQTKMLPSLPPEISYLSSAANASVFMHPECPLP